MGVCVGGWVCGLHFWFGRNVACVCDTSIGVCVWLLHCFFGGGGAALPARGAACHLYNAQKHCRLCPNELPLCFPLYSVNATQLMALAVLRTAVGGHSTTIHGCPTAFCDGPATALGRFEDSMADSSLFFLTPAAPRVVLYRIEY